MVLFFLAGAGIAQQYQSNWEPNRYKVFCARLTCLGTQYPTLYSTVEKNLEEIVGKYKADGWQAQDKLGPVEGISRSNARTIVTELNVDNYAWTESDCVAKTAGIKFGKKTEEIVKRKHWLYYFFAHEMFHVTQYTYAAFDTCNEKRYGWVGESLAAAVGLDFTRRKFGHPTFPITDSTDATEPQTEQLLDVDLNAYNETFNVMEREVLSDAGGREYHVPLNWQDFHPDGTENNTTHPRYYRTSGLWRHLAEVYYDGSYTFIKDYLSGKANNPATGFKNDWLDWTHRNLLADKTVPLWQGFALYMADVANWHRKDRPAMHFDETRWHKILYGGCLKYKISPSDPKVEFDIEIRRSSARCIQITAEGLNPGERKAINAGAFVSSTFKNADHADALHLSLASSTDKQGLDCSESLRHGTDKEKMEARDKCVFGFGTGEINGEIKSTVFNYRGRVWDVVPQEAKAGSTSFTNTYILSRMAANPTDDPEDDGGAKLKISVVFVLDSPDAAIDNKKLEKLGKVPSIGLFNRSPVNFLPAAFAQDDPSVEIFGQKLKTVRVVGHLNGSPANYSQETVPRYGKDGKQAIATRTPGAVMPSVPIFDIFGANPALSPQGKSANTAGIWMLRWTAVEVEEDGLYQQALNEMGANYIAAMPLDSNGKDPRPLQIGDSGEFKAMVTARVGLKTLYTRTPATLKVDEYSLYVLRARLEGTLCEAPLESRRRSDECVNPQPISATMVKAFAGLHDPSSRFIIEDTPATQQYARARQALMNEALNQTSTETPMPPDVEAGPSDDGAVVIRGCTCSCDDMPYLQKLEKYFKSGEKLSSSVMQRFQKMMRCMAPCTPHYQSCKLKLR